MITLKTIDKVVCEIFKEANLAVKTKKRNLTDARSVFAIIATNYGYNSTEISVYLNNVINRTMISHYINIIANVNDLNYQAKLKQCTEELYKYQNEDFYLSMGTL